MRIHLTGNIRLIIMHLFSFSSITNWSVRATFFPAIPTKVTQITKELLLNLFPKQQTLETVMFEKPWAGSGNRLQNSPLSLGSITREMMPCISSVVL